MTFRKPHGRTFVAVFLAAVFALVTAAAAMDYRLISIGTAGKDGVYYPAGGAICHIVNARRWEDGIRCVAKSTAGSVYNLGALRAGTLDIALAQSDWQYQAYKGKGAFESVGPDKGLRSLFSLHAEPFTVVVRRDSGISSLKDLKGKRVNVGTPGSGNRATVDVLLDALGWTEDDFALAAEFPSNEQADALCNNQVDAVMFVVGHPSRSIQDMVTECDAVLIPVAGPAIDRLVAEKPYYWKTTIPGGLYDGNPEATPTFGIGATLVTSARVDPQVIYQVVKAVFEHLAEFKETHPALANLDKTRMVRDGLTAPLHEGAKLYYRQAGLL